jgi:hypothetical protein
MRYLMMYRSSDAGPPSPETMAAIGKFSQEMAQSGALIDTGGLIPAKGSKVVRKGGKFTTTDGPFPETKELIIGYAVVEASSREEAAELARRFMDAAGDGEGDIWLMMQGGPP